MVDCNGFADVITDQHPSYSDVILALLAISAGALIILKP